VTSVRPEASFDHQSTEHAKDAVSAYRRLREKSPVAWTDSHGGYWVVSGYPELIEVTEQPEVFSSAKGVDENGRYVGGVHIPTNQAEPPLIPEEVDPPMWQPYRRAMARPFSAPAVRELEPKMRAFTNEYIDRFIETGSCDLIDDLANPVPAGLILDLLGLPLEDTKFFASPHHALVAEMIGSDKHNQAIADMHTCHQKVAQAVRDRFENPRDDMISDLTRAKVDGRPITEDEAVRASMVVLGGGVDTTTSFLGHAFLYLSEHPDQRERLREHPDKIGHAVEEILRYFSPVQSLGRSATCPVKLAGQQIEAGERVLLAFASANRDGRVFPDADALNLERAENRHVGFGHGIHKCIGIHFARREIEVILQEVITRMPDFRVVKEESHLYDRIGAVSGWKAMPTVFTPGPRLDRSQSSAG
jgi:cytochrome P450